MTTAREYTWKPAALGRPTVCKVSAKRMAYGDDWQVDFDDVTAAAFSSQVIGHSRFIRLDLWAAGKMRSLSYAASAKGWQADPDARVFLGLARDVLRRLADIRPDLEVTLGWRGGPRAAMFVVGLASLIGGVGIFIAALATGVSGERLIGAAVPMLFLVGLGAMVSYSYSPWRKPATANPGAVATMIDGMIAKLTDSAAPPHDG